MLSSSSALLEYLSGSSNRIPNRLLPFLLAITLEFPVWRAFYSSAHFTMRIWWEQHFSTKKSRHHYLMGHGTSMSVSSITEANWSTKSQTAETFLCAQFDLVVVLYIMWVGLIIRAQKMFWDKKSKWIWTGGKKATAVITIVNCSRQKCYFKFLLLVNSIFFSFHVAH